MKNLLIALLAFVPYLAGATSVPPRSLTDLVADADHVVIGKVTVVDMVDGKGVQVTNSMSRTGPGLHNTIRLHISVETNGVLFTTAGQVPPTLTNGLWTLWHYTLKQIKEIEEGQTRIFLLKGPKFDFVDVSGFSRSLSERAEIEAMIMKRSDAKQVTQAPQHKPLTPEAQAILTRLNQQSANKTWQSEVDMIERPETRPLNYKTSGEVNAFVGDSKKRLAEQGVILRWNADKKQYEVEKTQKAPSATLDNLVHIDAVSAGIQHPLVCGAGRDFPAGHEITFENPQSGEFVHAVFPEGVVYPKTLDGKFVLQGKYQGIQNRKIYTLKKVAEDYKYFVVSSWEQKQ